MCFFCKLSVSTRVWDPKGPIRPGFDFRCVWCFLCGGLNKRRHQEPDLFFFFGKLTVPPQPPPPQPPKKKSSDSDGSGLVVILLVVGLRAIIEPTSDSRTKVGPTRWRSKPAGQELGGQLAPSIALAVSRRSTHAKRNDEKNKTYFWPM